jgi:phosphatidylinositol glycan class V
MVSKVTYFCWRGNGFLAYYEIKQIPNFLLACPTILISAYGIWSYISYDRLRFLTVGLRCDSVQANTATREDNARQSPSATGFYSDNILPHVYLWLILLLISVTSMHVQVITRFFSSLPILYWFVAHTWLQAAQPSPSSNQRIIAKSILYYQVLYGLVGIVLFASFFPPA